ncbi:MAG: hypothetical protein JWP97_4488 [Labilithrix sp.]|nr:hypothetical protein [Labilithrix sp.]
MTTHVTDPSDADEAAGTPGVSGVAGRTAAAPVSAPDSRAAAAAWIGLGVVGLLAVLVFWVFEALPFQDLPAHAGLIAMRHRFGTTGFESRFFVLAPHIGPYSVFRFLGEAFVRVIGPVGAVRALATLPIVATPAVMLFARRRLMHDRTPLYGFLGLTLSFGFMTLMGFASYLLGVAVMMLGFTMWLELMIAADERAADLGRRELVMAAFAPLIFVAHGHAFVLFLLCAGLSAICFGWRPSRLWRLRALVPALALAAYVAWLERGATTPAGSVPVIPPLVPVFQGPYAKLGLLITPTLMTRSGVDTLIGLCLWALAGTSTFYTVRALRQTTRAASLRTAGRVDLGTIPAAERHARALYAAASALFVLFLVLPHAIGWFGFVDGRLLPIVLMLALLGVQPAALPRQLRRIAELGIPASAAALATVALVASYFFQEEARGYREVLDRVPSGATLLNLPVEPNSRIFTGHPFIHYDKLVLADRPVVVSDVWFHQGSALYPTPQNPSLRLPETYSESDLKVIDWPAYHLEDWEFVLMRTRPSSAQPYTPEGLVLAEHVGGWWLFRRAAASAAR